MDININKDESIDDLDLKGLKLIQKEKAFRFGIDAVLLSDFANVKSKHRAIDLCTGTGIVPFLLYGKYNPKEVWGIEIQEEMEEMARRSSKLNGTEDIVKFKCADLKDKNLVKELGRFDVLTVNPPYKLNNAGIVNPNDKLAIARHEILCNLEDVIAAARRLLKDNGRMFIVHRPERLADIFGLMRKYNIEPKRVKMVQPNVNKAPNIVLVEGSVEVTDRNERKAQLVPSDLLNIANGAIAYQKQVDVAEYISWVDGVMLLNGNDLSHIIQKLSIYYGIPIQCDPMVGKEKVYGKLDLKDDIDEVIECIRQTIPIEVEKSDTSIYLSK